MTITTKRASSLQERFKDKNEFTKHHAQFWVPTLLAPHKRILRNMVAAIQPADQRPDISKLEVGDTYNNWYFGDLAKGFAGWEQRLNKMKLTDEQQQSLTALVPRIKALHEKLNRLNQRLKVLFHAMPAIQSQELAQLSNAGLVSAHSKAKEISITTDRAKPAQRATKRAIEYEMLRRITVDSMIGDLKDYLVDLKQFTRGVEVLQRDYLKRLQIKHTINSTNKDHFLLDPNTNSVSNPSVLRKALNMPQVDEMPSPLTVDSTAPVTAATSYLQVPENNMFPMIKSTCLRAMGALANKPKMILQDTEITEQVDEIQGVYNEVIQNVKASFDQEETKTNKAIAAEKNAMKYGFFKSTDFATRRTALLEARVKLKELQAYRFQMLTHIRDVMLQNLSEVKTLLMQRNASVTQLNNSFITLFSTEFLMKKQEALQGRIAELDKKITSPGMLKRIKWFFNSTERDVLKEEHKALSSESEIVTSEIALAGNVALEVYDTQLNTMLSMNEVDVASIRKDLEFLQSKDLERQAHKEQLLEFLQFYDINKDQKDLNKLVSNITQQYITLTEQYQEENPARQQQHCFQMATMLLARIPYGADQPETLNPTLEVLINRLSSSQQLKLLEFMLEKLQRSDDPNDKQWELIDELSIRLQQSALVVSEQSRLEALHHALKPLKGQHAQCNQLRIVEWAYHDSFVYRHEVPQLLQVYQHAVNSVQGFEPLYENALKRFAGAINETTDQVLEISAIDELHQAHVAAVNYLPYLEGRVQASIDRMKSSVLNFKEFKAPLILSLENRLEHHKKALQKLEIAYYRKCAEGLKQEVMSLLSAAKTLGELSDPNETMDAISSELTKIQYQIETIISDPNALENSDNVALLSLYMDLNLTYMEQLLTLQSNNKALEEYDRVEARMLAVMNHSNLKTNPNFEAVMVGHDKQLLALNAATIAQRGADHVNIQAMTEAIKAKVSQAASTEFSLTPLSFGWQKFTGDYKDPSTQLDEIMQQPKHTKAQQLMCIKSFVNTTLNEIKNEMRKPVSPGEYRHKRDAMMKIIREMDVMVEKLAASTPDLMTCDLKQKYDGVRQRLVSALVQPTRGKSVGTTGASYKKVHSQPSTDELTTPPKVDPVAQEIKSAKAVSGPPRGPK